MEVKIEATPDQWLKLHQVATGASLAAGALAYAVSSVAGRTATSLLSNTIRIGGSVAAYGGRLIVGDAAGLGIQAGAQTAAFLVERTGESATVAGALLASTATAVTVGSSILIGHTLYDLWKNSRFATPLPSPQQDNIPLRLIDSIEEIEHEIEEVPVGNSGCVIFLLEDKKPQQEVEDGGSSSSGSSGESSNESSGS